MAATTTSVDDDKDKSSDGCQQPCAERQMGPLNASDRLGAGGLPGVSSAFSELKAATGRET
jgi:hypothetical protein